MKLFITSNITFLGLFQESSSELFISKLQNNIIAPDTGINPSDFVCMWKNKAFHSIVLQWGSPTCMYESMIATCRLHGSACSRYVDFGMHFRNESWIPTTSEQDHHVVSHLQQVTYPPAPPHIHASYISAT